MVTLRLLYVGQPETGRGVTAIDGKDLLKVGCGIIQLVFGDVQLHERKVSGDEVGIVRIGGDERGAGFLGVAMHHEEVAEKLLDGGGFGSGSGILLDLLDGLNWLVISEISTPQDLERAQIAGV